MGVPNSRIESMQASYIYDKRIEDKKIYAFFKKYMDVFGALMGLIVLAPIFLFVAFLIKMEDPKGPVIFKQVRVGRNGKSFEMYKFRSMVVDAENILQNLLDKNEVSGAMFKMKVDPRITRIGKFIRKTSIDELPQLWNVVKGEMSLVGPRPPLPREVESYTEYDKQRLMVIPGCTGLWQVSGRSNLGFKEMVDLDLEYIRNRSVLFDLKIIFKTFREIVASKNAY